MKISLMQLALALVFSAYENWRGPIGPIMRITWNLGISTANLVLGISTKTIWYLANANVSVACLLNNIFSKQLIPFQWTFLFIQKYD